MSEQKTTWWTIRTYGGQRVALVEVIKETDKTLILSHTDWGGSKRRVHKGNDYFPTELEAWGFLKRRDQDNVSNYRANLAEAEAKLTTSMAKVDILRRK